MRKWEGAGIMAKPLAGYKAAQPAKT